MPTCPHCNEKSPRRKKKTCPLCGEIVWIVREGRGKKKTTIWVGDETRASELVYFLEEHIRKRPGMKHFTFGEVGSSHRNAQISIAKTLLKKCGYSQELAIAVVDAYCAGDRRLFAPRNMQDVIGKRQFSMALAIAKYNVEQKQAKVEAEQRKLEDAARSKIGALQLFATV